MPKPIRATKIAERTGIRPSLWIAAAVFLGAAGLVVYEVMQVDTSPAARAEARRAERRERSEPAGTRARRERGARGVTRSSARSGGGYQRHDWGAESELSRRVSLGLPLPSFWREPSRQTLESDPQLAAMFRSFSGMRAEDADAPPLPFEPMAHRAQLVEAEGDVSNSPTSCDVRVLPVEGGRYNCLVRVMCDGAVLYPNDRQDAGYVPCDVEGGRAVRGVDDAQTDRDGDPLVDLDLARGTVTVEDYAPDGQRRYRATLRINNS